MAGEACCCWVRGKRAVKVWRGRMVGRGEGARRKVVKIVCSEGGIVCGCEGGGEDRRAIVVFEGGLFGWRFWFVGWKFLVCGRFNDGKM